ncbi:intracellular sulfur oxidation DsrE/DsrF family protein [Duganella sp. 1224]|uniref:DsrE family protein n=1 Tax=Duganella sp. 1224 TaxID=2587052 RepID=UPI0015CED5D4|nr:DsrE family protein [Duganella sp. 1224]NYE58924.1 intracellular sulfur oxidation DsrE/DsrF family protein [Duganella sp. 1224]
MASDVGAVPRLVILLERAASAPEAAAALRYAATAAAMDVAVEVHAVSAAAVALLRRGHGDAAWQTAIADLLALDVQLYACPHALAAQGMQPADLRDGVTGVRGAASLLAAGLAPGGRFMVF